MPECECLPTCPFFGDRMENMPAMSRILKLRYCQGDSSDCARHIVYLAKGRDSRAVPSDLYPNQLDVALALADRCKAIA